MCWSGGDLFFTQKHPLGRKEGCKQRKKIALCRPLLISHLVSSIVKGFQIANSRLLENTCSLQKTAVGQMYY